MMAAKEIYPFVEIVWDDAASNVNSWVSPQDLAKPERILSRGWLVREDDTYVVVAASIVAEGTIEDDVSNTTCIPKGMIVDRSELKFSRKRKNAAQGVVQKPVKP
jgi:hypothetical protein